MQDILNQLDEKRGRARLGGGVKRVEAQHAGVELFAELVADGFAQVM